MARRVVVSALVILGLLGGLWLSLGLAHTFSRDQSTIGVLETITLKGPSGETDVEAKVDTGADFSSIDQSLALSLGYTLNTQETKRIITELGVAERPTVGITYILSDREVSSIATVADRSQFTTRIILGKADLRGFVVDPTGEFLTRPAQERGLRFANPVDIVAGDRLEQVLLLVPILATLIVFLRLFVGVRTYGVFAPTVIAITLLGPNLLLGIATYVVLVLAGIAAKVFLLDRLRLAHISQLALIMFILVAFIAAITSMYGERLSFGATFFPLIVTAHLIEQATRSLDEHGAKATMTELGTTMVAAVSLAAIGRFLIGQPVAVLWVFFAVAMGASIVAGNYLGLRFTELVRFRFLRRTHVHS